MPASLGAVASRAGVTIPALAILLGRGGPRVLCASPLGTVQGKVEVRQELAAPPPRPDPGALGMPKVPAPPDRRQSVVFLEHAPRGAFEEPERRRARMDQRNESFVPYVLAVTAGTIVDFPNHDGTYHNVFSLSKPKRFDLGRYARGRSKAVRFDRPGVVRVFCDIHSHMSAFILVFAHRFFATTDAEGRYRIDHVPAGTYSIAAWNAGQVRETRTVRVPETGGTVELDFVVP